MTVTPTYPGIYIEEVPSSARTVTPAPTSTAVFVGYSHPLKTKSFGTAEPVFSFTEYERKFGGLFQSGLIDRNLPYAIYQFFLNGGSTAYVVGLESTFFDGSDSQGSYTGATASPDGSSITLTAREPTDSVAMTVTVSNVRAAADDTANKVADLQIAYGGMAETIRGVDLSIVDVDDPGYVLKRLASSSLVTAAVTGELGTFLPVGETVSFAFAADPVSNGWTVGRASDYTAVFADDSSLDKVDVFNLLVLPGVTDPAIWPVAQAFAEKKRAFAIMDPPADRSADGASGLDEIGDYVDEGEVPVSSNAAFYFPYLRTTDPLTGAEIELPPSGFVSGIYARTDTNRGVWKAPAGLETVVRNTLGVVDEGRMTDMRQGLLNPKGVNCLRTFPGVGTVVYGARTTVTRNPAFEQWRYIPVRRTALFIEQSLYASLGWVVFEPNATPLWTAIRISIERFMLGLFKQGAFFGDKPSDAFLVQCDETTTTQEDIDLGKVNVIVGFRPLKPAEFVIVKITQLAGQVQS